ncbi:MAG: UDP-N-acetylglucosamine 1-carboxyvinyltransferase [Anaerofustis sp.]
MDKILIRGGNRLTGEVSITGAKNAALGILPATLLCGETCLIENLPDIQDIRNYVIMLRKLGADVTVDAEGNTRIDTSHVTPKHISEVEEESTKMRASYYLLGTLLSKFRDVRLPLPGGCAIGARPIDQHIKGFEALGASVELKNGYIHVYADQLVGASIYLDVVSVGATINIMLASVMAEGTTVIENAAKEPHVVDIANFLNLMGANIKGAGTDVIKIVGVDRLNGCTYSVIPDQITAGTYMIAAAATQGDVVIKNVIPKHMEPITAKLIEMGNEVTEYDDSIRVVGKRPLQAISIKTLPYPGFPTDLQQPMGVLMCLSEGVSTITESIFESRFKYVNELIRMGADVMVNGNIAVFKGGNGLSGARINATDLRAGAAMIIAGLAAEGMTEVYELKHIDRGYDNIVGRLQKLGADIVRTED